ncbi:hypothetical protein L227DRAFT_568489 [Lentinus tigrinus ALCF2SS1-6]|uniref:Uncharacterized protein n=1 Tax=Lentinus tigrinus ALCF2SS1-6 TaxID=1328759 RepID=A0A5C2RM39_9APHY|nr:hypothetical protein L227DRAFT_568489 [Lentinus tigrinus ALCF2SS1-6]
MSSDWDSADWDSDSVPDVTEQNIGPASVAGLEQRDRTLHDSTMRARLHLGRPATLQIDTMQSRNLQIPVSSLPVGHTLASPRTIGASRATRPNASGPADIYRGRTMGELPTGNAASLPGAAVISSMATPAHSVRYEPSETIQPMQWHSLGTTRQTSVPLLATDMSTDDRSKAVSAAPRFTIASSTSTSHPHRSGHSGNTNATLPRNIGSTASRTIARSVAALPAPASPTVLIGPGFRGNGGRAVAQFVLPKEWIDEWLELQPLSRFRGAQPSIQHPSALLYPEETDPSDWALFWLHTRQVVFGFLLGFKMCSPFLTGATDRPCCMEREQWAAWLDDVLWVFYELLNHMELHGKVLLRPYVKTGDALSLSMGNNADAMEPAPEGGLVSEPIQPGPLLLPNKKRSLDEREGAEASGSDMHLGESLLQCEQGLEVLQPPMPRYATIRVTMSEANHEDISVHHVSEYKARAGMKTAFW